MIRDRIRALAAGAAFMAACTLASCGPLPPPQTSPGVPAPTRPSPHTTTSPVASPRAAVVDSTPSPDAVRVLGTIPDPIPASERVPPPAPGTPSEQSPVPNVPNAAAPDSSGSGADVPVPTPTRALGDRPNPMSADSSAAQPGANPTGAAPPSASTPPASPSTPSASPPATHAPAAPDTCWRVQVGAPKESEKATSLRDAAQSQLLVPMVIEHEQRLYKVRTRDCWDRTAAAALRSRAVASGFSGAFLFVSPKP